jgi:hypothetical protein
MSNVDSCAFDAFESALKIREWSWNATGTTLIRLFDFVCQSQCPEEDLELHF